MTAARHFLLSGALLVAASCSSSTQPARPQVAEPRPPPTWRPTPSAQPAPTQQAVRPPTGYREAIEAIAAAIERAKSDFPQLARFSAREHCNGPRLVVSYGHSTHRARHRGGWTSGVPNPDDDGVWFHVDFHDPDSQAQIHTQPVVEDLRFRDKKVMVLILEGQHTRRFAPTLRQILLRHGVRPR